VHFTQLYPRKHAEKCSKNAVRISALQHFSISASQLLVVGLFYLGSAVRGMFPAEALPGLCLALQSNELRYPAD
jgi:hypothetical protein